VQRSDVIAQDASGTCVEKDFSLKVLQEILNRSFRNFRVDERERTFRNNFPVYIYIQIVDATLDRYGFVVEGDVKACFSVLRRDVPGVETELLKFIQ
jgi:hypothetical protein